MRSLLVRNLNRSLELRVNVHQSEMVTFQVRYPFINNRVSVYWNLLFVVFAATLVGCGGGTKEKAEAPAYTNDPIARSANPSGSFTLLSATETGLSFVSDIQEEHEFANVYEGPFAAQGIAIGDLDGDTVPEILFAGGPRPSRLYKQTKPFNFVDVTGPSNINSADPAWSVSASFADIDNDGDLDIYVCNYRAPNELWINDGRGIFSNEAEAYGVDVNDASVMAYFGDFNRNGYVDLFLLTNRYYFAGDTVPDLKMDEVTGRAEIDETLEDFFKLAKNSENKLGVVTRARENRIFRNRVGQKFEEATRSSGIMGESHGVSAVLWDYDNDNDLDIYVCNDGSDPDELYENEGRFRFKKITDSTLKHTSWLSRGSSVADVNNDGLLDLFTVGSAGSNHLRHTMMKGDPSLRGEAFVASKPPQLARNLLHVNSGPCYLRDSDEFETMFLETAHSSGIAGTDNSWSALFRDFDNDGLVDLFVANGDLRDYRNPDRDDLPAIQSAWQAYKGEKPVLEKNFAFKNVGELSFQDTSSEWGLDLEGVSHVAATGDFDQDGDLDLIVTNSDQSVSVYRNDLNALNSITIRMIGMRSNRQGIGARVEVETTDGRIQFQQLAPQNGFLASNESLLQFGVGENTEVKRVTVNWPAGEYQQAENVKANQLLTFFESERGPSTIAKDYGPIFEQVTNISIPKRAERDFDDFAEQPLLPNQMSELGPGIGIGDVNRDKKEEIYVAHPCGQIRSIGLRKESEIKEDSLFFQTIQLRNLESHREEYSPLFFDVDGDMDQDLYITAGGIENEEEKWYLIIDTILVNAGLGGFQNKTPQVLKDVRIRGAAGAVADYDRDGDVDLFLGGRIKRGEYPRSPRSALLRNETEENNQPVVFDATLTDSDNLMEFGMVTSCCWSDLNNDGWVDLLAATEWGPVKVFMNREGKLVKATEECGLAYLKGRWNGLAVADFDNDGDMDFVATNFGLNTPYKASSNHPAKLHLVKFRDSDQPAIIETIMDAESERVFRNKRVFTDAIPRLKEKYPTFAEFAAATYDDLFDKVFIESDETFELTELGSCVFLNDGNGVFEAQHLPTLVQSAPSFGVVATDFDGDGNNDIFIAQNFSTGNDDVGLLAGGLGVVLLGDGKGNFDQQWPCESGIAIQGSAKGVAMADFNEDFRPDLVVGITRERPKFYYNRSKENGFFGLMLKSPKTKNTAAIGARVEVVFDDGSRQYKEVCVGGGYMSQSTNNMYFGLGESRKPIQINVRWPDGSSSKHTLPRTLERIVEITQLIDDSEEK